MAVYDHFHFWEEETLLRDCRCVAAWADEIDGVPLGRRICGEAVVLFRDDQGGVAVPLMP